MGETLNVIHIYFLQYIILFIWYFTMRSVLTFE